MMPRGIVWESAQQRCSVRPWAQLLFCATRCDHPQCFPRTRILSLSFQFTMSNFQSILDAADKYAQQTGINLNQNPCKNPFADKVKDCDSPSAVLLLLQENLKAFKCYRDNNRKFIECVSPVVQFVHAFSDILGEAAGLVVAISQFTTYFPFTISSQDTVPTSKTHFCRNRCSLHRAYLPPSLAEWI